MNLRKFMHPRNKYRDKPDFKKLAILYPEFGRNAITDLTGKVKINFKNEESLRVLTRILLKHDFGLEVEIPKEKLVPALPLRLNYILWIEDLLRHFGLTDISLAHGLDIGTGAVCIYPLLLAKIYGCRMIGTEIQQSSIESALKNVKCNNLQDLIQVIPVSKDTILENAVPKNETYSFSMCNPPFFETNEVSENNGQRLPPRNAPTGCKDELIVEGGEQKFVLKIIEDSMKMGDQIKIYTTMLGRKASLLFLLNEMAKKNISNVAWTEFCQGNTKRWGLAWTFLSRDILDLTKAPVIRSKPDDTKTKRSTDRLPVDLIFPIQDPFFSCDDVVKVLKTWISDLNIKMESLHIEENETKNWACRLTCYKDTWSHARKKRRMVKAQETNAKKICTAESTAQTQLKTSDSGKIVSEADLPNITSDKNNDSVNVNEEPSTLVDSSSKTESADPLLVCSLLLTEMKNENEECNTEETKRLCMRMIYEKGHGGKNSLEMFRQYLINKLNVREYLQKQGSSKASKRKKKKLKKCEPASLASSVQNDSSNK
ncbi:U6 small nuclear RNA (adenine-(43)-N(6))-methyltransferase isoform X2 [Cephus cinctus]|uniref:U6 small nuclear RNA (adenine-(43)-N(6))-methyltransferase n=1 Tax=Cephus cinctus TaxID=211228 RepID=A0AAJ7W253_CEPCN|nr:U6 small nuclear RNA (adenine-(43)-N(6))-methyltransferase isoform X2 [Cephus cinctus]